MSVSDRESYSASSNMSTRTNYGHAATAGPCYLLGGFTDLEIALRCSNHDRVFGSWALRTRAGMHL